MFIKSYAKEIERYFREGAEEATINGLRKEEVEGLEELIVGIYDIRKKVHAQKEGEGSLKGKYQLILRRKTK